MPDRYSKCQSIDLQQHHHEHHQDLVPPTCASPHAKEEDHNNGAIVVSNDDADDNNGDITDNAEKDILAKLLEYPDVVRRAANELEPHKVASYLYELARELNRYYEATPVATGDALGDIREARLGVLSKASQIFTHGLGLLGIEVPSQM